MLHTNQGIKLSDKEYHELHYVVLADDRFKIFGLERGEVETFAHKLKDAGIGTKELFELLDEKYTVGDDDAPIS